MAEERKRSHKHASTSSAAAAEGSLERQLAHKAQLRERLGPDPTNEAATDSEDELSSRRVPRLGCDVTPMHCKGVGVGCVACQRCAVARLLPFSLELDRICIEAC